MSIQRTKYDTWQVRWRDDGGQMRSKNLRTRAQAERFERQVRVKENADAAAVYEPLWRKVLRKQLDHRAAIDVDGFNPNGYFVYLLWDRTEDQPIYIGASKNVLARLGSHLNNPDRRHRVCRVTLVRCWNAFAMAATESKLIDFYKPELNLLDGNRRPVGKPPKLDRKAYSLPEAADLIGISKEALAELVEQGDVQAKKIGTRAVLIPVGEIKRCFTEEVPKISLPEGADVCATFGIEADTADDQETSTAS